MKWNKIVINNYQVKNEMRNEVMETKLNEIKI